MKKALWIVSFIPLIVTAVMLQFLPDKIPMHFDMAGNVNRWGSKAESFLLPVIMLLLTLMMTLFAGHFEKKSETAADEKEREAARSNAKILLLVGLFMVIINCVMQGVILYIAYTAAGTDISKSGVDMNKVTNLALGVGFIVIGNVMTKTRKNGLIGFRTRCSMYNDNTWRKSNRFEGIALMVAGVLTLVITAIADSATTATFLMLGCLVLMTVVGIIYSRKVYNEEIEAEKLAGMNKG